MSDHNIVRNTSTDWYTVAGTKIVVFSLADANSYIRAMPTGTVRTSFRERPDSRSRLYWLDIDVTFNDIVRQERIMSKRDIARLPPSALQYSTLHGAGTVANALSVGDSAATFTRFEVDVAAFIHTDENFEPSELNRSAKMLWNDLDAYAPRLEIHVQPKMLRHLVELYVTKRIDTVIMSMKIVITRAPIAGGRSSSELLPLLDKDGRLYFRRTQCELLSVHTSLADERVSREA